MLAQLGERENELLDSEVSLKALKEDKGALQHKIIQDEEAIRMDRELFGSRNMRRRNVSTKLSKVLLERDKLLAEKQDTERQLLLLEESFALTKGELKSQRDFFSSLLSHGETGRA